MRYLPQDPQDRKTDLRSTFLVMHPQGYPLAVEIDGHPHVILGLTQEDAQGFANRKCPLGLPLSVAFGHGNRIFHKAMEAGNSFAVAIGDQIHPVSHFALTGGPDAQ